MRPTGLDGGPLGYSSCTVPGLDISTSVSRHATCDVWPLPGRHRGLYSDISPDFRGEYYAFIPPPMCNCYTNYIAASTMEQYKATRTLSLF